MVIWLLGLSQTKQQSYERRQKHIINNTLPEINEKNVLIGNPYLRFELQMDSTRLSHSHFSHSQSSQPIKRQLKHWDFSCWHHMTLTSCNASTQLHIFTLQWSWGRLEFNQADHHHSLLFVAGNTASLILIAKQHWTSISYSSGHKTIWNTFIDLWLHPHRPEAFHPLGCPWYTLWWGWRWSRILRLLHRRGPPRWWGWKIIIWLFPGKESIWLFLDCLHRKESIWSRSTSTNTMWWASLAHPWCGRNKQPNQANKPTNEQTFTIWHHMTTKNNFMTCADWYSTWYLKSPMVYWRTFFAGPPGGLLTTGRAWMRVRNSFLRSAQTSKENTASSCDVWTCNFHKLSDSTSILTTAPQHHLFIICRGSIESEKHPHTVLKSQRHAQANQHMIPKMFLVLEEPSLENAASVRSIEQWGWTHSQAFLLEQVITRGTDNSQHFPWNLIKNNHSCNQATHLSIQGFFSS